MSSSSSLDRSDLEPEIARTISGIHTARASGPYRLCNEDELRARLEPFLRQQGLTDVIVEDLRRLGGGASKEQFIFTLNADQHAPRQCVLRMDPVEGAAISSRQREFEALRVVKGMAPVPDALWVDGNGGALGRPALITGFVDGVTKPSDTTTNVSGFGTVLGKRLRASLIGPFIEHLAAIHTIDVHTDGLRSFQVPNADPQQAARWQVNWWTSVWRNDALGGIPLLGLAEQWLRNNLPATAALSLIHSDYRTGNYLFDERTGDITAILDWEVVHIGDYHEDLAWIALKCWSHTEDGILLASGLASVDELMARYSAATSRAVDPATLYFYQILALYKCVVICLGSCLRAAHESHNHQDALMSWVATAGYAFMAELLDLMKRGGPI